MKATYAKHGADYLPAIRHDDGRIEVIHGDALADRPTAVKYARLHISDRRDGDRARTTAAR